ncbi:hypothetical protein EG328_009672 [Venturia inaequalis]|uniref:Uncharacterized protein n=1 Tax=Venturia inaequalis TaxID=5025 RepID=A0A8H3ZC06_VENIN|nr:hypothetical protein EG328_009672 [Venturia inaequalis]KAE9986816.1 hypothetical protein EG327_004118 [Venturia inaequalis]
MSSTTAWALLGVVILFISGGITYWVITIYQRKNQGTYDFYDRFISNNMPFHHVARTWQRLRRR